jgi:hypothetical protein
MVRDLLLVTMSVLLTRIRETCQCGHDPSSFEVLRWFPPLGRVRQRMQPDTLGTGQVRGWELSRGSRRSSHLPSLARPAGFPSQSAMNLQTRPPSQKSPWPPRGRTAKVSAPNHCLAVTTLPHPPVRPCRAHPRRRGRSQPAPVPGVFWIVENPRPMAGIGQGAWISQSWQPLHPVARKACKPMIRIRPSRSPWPRSP